jgi:hypothetical protein
VSDLTGQIGLVPHAHTLVEHAIDWATDETVHHAVLAISPTECISCEPKGAIRRLISDFPDAYWSDYDIASDERDRIVAWALVHEGDPYSYAADAAIGVYLIFGIRTPKMIERRLNSGHRFECAQFCDNAHRAGGRDPFKDRAPAMIFPGSFAPTWRAHGWMPPLSARPIQSSK